MERVAFLLPTGERIPCLLNPEHVVQRRVAGLRSLVSATGSLSGATMSDTPLLHTGGGRTEIELDLLFDVQLARAPAPLAELPPRTAADTRASGERPTAGAEDPLARGASPTPPPPADVRDLTGPLWKLTENSGDDGRAVPLVRFVWGKAWNILAVVESCAERLERFSPGGVPGRSWMRLRLVRQPDTSPAHVEDPTETSRPIPDPEAVRDAPVSAVHTVVGAGSPAGEPPAGGETLPVIAARLFPGQPWMWRWLADANPDTDVVWPEPGTELSVPAPPSAAAGGEP